LKIRFTLMGIFLLWAFVGCKEADPCAGIICLQGGCLEGVCACNPGYEGLNCELEERQKFLGLWEAGDICLGGSHVYEVEIFRGNGIQDLLLAGLYQRSDTVNAKVEGINLTVDLQAFGIWTIQGNGTIDTMANPVTISLDYEIDFGGGIVDHCLLQLQPLP